MDTEDHKYQTVCLISAQHGIQAMFTLKHTHTHHQILNMLYKYLSNLKIKMAVLTPTHILGFTQCKFFHFLESWSLSTSYSPWVLMVLCINKNCLCYSSKVLASKAPPTHKNEPKKSAQTDK